MKDTISLIKTRQEAKDKLISLLKKYLYKFVTENFQELEEKKKNLLEFQKKMYSIPNWSSSRKQKEFKLLLKYLDKKYKVSEEEINNLLEKVFVLQIRILVKSQVEMHLPTLKDFWYKVLQHTAKYFYEHPRDMKILQELETTHLKVIDNIIDNTLTKYLPITKMLEDDKKDVTLKYNFDDVNIEIQEQIEDQSKLQVIKESDSDVHSENSLRYISSEQFENEYYQPDPINADMDDSKQINIPKFYKKKSGKKQVNEINENFFD
jgi:hypothetical protein